MVTRGRGGLFVAWLVTCLSGITLVTVSVAQAHQGWSIQQHLGHVGQYPREGITLAGNAHGDAAIVWQASDGSLQLTLAKPGEPFGRARRISGSADGSPFIAMDRRGDVLIAWTSSDNSFVVPPNAREPGCCERVRTTMVRADGRILSHQTLTSHGTLGEVISVAVTPDGATAAVLYRSTPMRSVGSWQQADSASLALRVARFGARFGRRVGLGKDSVGSLRAGARDMAVVYGEPQKISSELSEADMAESHISPTGRLLTTRYVGTLSYTEKGVGSMQFAYDARGDLAVLFTRGQHRLVIATLRANGLFHTHTIHTVPRPARGRTFYAPTESVAPSGLGIVTWSGGYSADAVGAAIGLLPSAAFQLAAVLHPLPPGRAIDVMHNAIDSRGQAAMILTGSGPYGEGHNVTAILRSASGHFSRPIVLADFGDLEVTSNPQVLLDEHGRGIAAWVGLRNRVIAQRIRAP